GRVVLGCRQSLAGRCGRSRELRHGLDRGLGGALGLFDMAAPLLGSRAQPAHVLVDEPNLPAQRVDAVAPTFALQLALLQCGALGRDLSDTCVQLATQPPRSLLGVNRSTLQLVKLPLLYF